MTNKIDFETKSRTPIKAGASKYSKDAYPLCLSYSLDDGVTVKSWEPGEPDPVDLFEAIKRGEEIHAHNATFEINIWQNVMVPMFDWPPVSLEQWRCTAAECLALGLPASLDEAGKTLKTTITKDMVGKRLMQKMSKPRKPTKNNKAEWHDKPEERLRLRQYCDADVRSECAVGKKVRRLSAREQKVFTYDQVVNARGVKIDRDLAESVEDVWQQYTDKLNNELHEITFGQVNTADEVKAITEFLPKIGVKGVYSLAKNVISEALQRTDLPPTGRRVLEIRKELAMSSVSKFSRMLLCAEEDDRIRGVHQYHGAQTGRYAGRLVQFQNLPRGTLKLEDIEWLVDLIKQRDLEAVELLSPEPIGKLLSSLCRAAIIAEEGKRLLVCDFASIEARALAWAAGEEWMLKAFRDGEDLYKAMAADIYGIPVSEVNKEQRFYGKTATLGCGYQLGGSGLQRNLKDQFGIETELPFCEKIVKAYRAKNTRIRSLWYKLEEAAIQAIKTSQPHRAGPYTFHIREDWLHLRMPCGRDISYYKPEIVPGPYGEQIRYLGTDIRGKSVRTHTYAGKLCENATQSICRDLLVEAMSRLERAGYPVVFHVHDEIACEVPIGHGSIEEMEAIMCEVPKWAEGFPVAAEGFETLRYRK